MKHNLIYNMAACTHSP